LAYQNGIESIAIGSFDGIHYAHKRLIEQVDAMVVIERGRGYLTAGVRRADFTDVPIFFYHFERIKALHPQEFVAKLQEDFPSLEKIVVGYDFQFGKDKAGDASLLRSLCQKEVVVVDEVKLDGISVHSRTIKRYLQEGNITLVNRLLDRQYSIQGRIVRGQGLGRASLVPTLNLVVRSYQLPASGVYATWTKIDGVVYPSVSFLGHRVTTDGSFAIESHVIGQELGVCCGEVEIAFIDFIRTNQKFESLEALKEQIMQDIKQVKERLDVQR
jgi:riboflavin kinase/FMN adenylyltransferase